MGQNPFTLAFARFFPNESFAWKTQLRWGFGRISGPYGQSELAGMMLFFGLILTLWLGFNHEWEPKFKSLPDLPLKKSTLIAWTLGFTLLMTQARGPWLGAMLAVPVAMVGRAKHVLRASILTAIVVIVGGSLSLCRAEALCGRPADQRRAADRAVSQPAARQLHAGRQGRRPVGLGFALSAGRRAGFDR